MPSVITDKYQTKIASLVHKGIIKTPCLLIDVQEVKKNLALFTKRIPANQIFYAVKANSAPRLLKFLNYLGISFDVASCGEIAVLKGLGVPGSRMLVSTPIKKAELTEAMLKEECALFAADTLQELERVAKHQKTRSSKFLPKLLVRFQVENSDVGIRMNDKFGCSSSEVLPIMERAIEMGFELGGVCFHVGSHAMNPEIYKNGINIAAQLFEQIQNKCQTFFKIIDIGGGFCDQAMAVQHALNFPEYYETLDHIYQEAIQKGYEIYSEPGRALVGSAGISVASLTGTSIRNGRHWAYLDDGMYGCFSIKTYEKNSFVFQLLKNAKVQSQKSEALKPWAIAGPTCDSLDVIAYDVSLPEDMNTGDLIIVPNMGAYSIATASTFNGISIPECYLVDYSNPNAELWDLPST